MLSTSQATTTSFGDKPATGVMILQIAARDAATTTSYDSTTTQIVTVTIGVEPTPTLSYDSTTTEIVTVTVGGFPTQTGSSTFTTSIVDASVKDWGVIGDLILPANTNVGCENCSFAWYITCTASGFDPSGSAFDAIKDFYQQGYVNIEVSKFNAYLDMSVESLPGFSLLETFFVLQNQTIASFDITDRVSIELVVEVGIPLSVTLESAVKIPGGLAFSTSNANALINFGTPSASSLIGTVDWSVLPFHVSAPDLAFSGHTGLALRVHAIAHANMTDFQTEGELIFELGLPSMNFTASIADNVDDNCQPSTTSDAHPYGIALAVDNGVRLASEGELKISYESYDASGKADEFPQILYPISSITRCLV